MRTAEFNARDLERLLQQRTVCTFAQLAEALGTESRMTVFRKLAALPYLTSDSHRGIWFSTDGTLSDTSKLFVEQSASGYSASELDNALHVETRQSLLHLVHQHLIERQRLEGARILNPASSASTETVPGVTGNLWSSRSGVESSRPPIYLSLMSMRNAGRSTGRHSPRSEGARDRLLQNKLN